MIGPEQLAAEVRRALADAGLPDRDPELERPRHREHGDWATNVALALAKPVGAPPREIAQRIVDALAEPEGVDHVEVAGPGFINFHLSQGALADVVRTAVEQGPAYGRGDAHAGQRVNVEFVSANPTGPLHIGAGRWMAVGDALARLLETTGAEVTREYYFNDAGEQMRKFGASVAAAMRGEPPPDDGYKGAYVTELAEQLRAEHEAAADDAAAADNAAADNTAADNTALAEAAYQAMLARITETLDRFGVAFDVFFGERALHRPDRIPAVVARLREAGYAYDADGATWLAAGELGDDKDRVLIKADGEPTYFAADCAYLVDKLARGYDTCLYLLGADHHGYVKRLHAIERALGEPGRVEVVIGQMVNFVRAGEPIKMSKRAGDMITVDDLIDEVGVDAARYTFLRTSIDQTMDFDLAAVVREDKDNPIYYVQYSSARIAGILRTAAEKGVEPGEVAQAPLERLIDPHEIELIRRLGTYPETVAEAASERAPHKVARYAEELAEAFHKFYTECRVVTDDGELTVARYWLCQATRETLAGALGLLGVSAPERM